MSRKVTVGVAAVVLIAIVVWGYLSMSGTPAGPLTVNAIGQAPRVGDDAAYSVRYTNATGQAVTNPQYHTVVRVGDDDWTCQGYQDPTTGSDIMGTDPESHPLTVPANQELQVTIYCRIPADTALASAKVIQRP